MARVYKSEDTGDLIYWAVGLLLLGVWCVKDGWYPSKDVLEKHPRAIELSFSQDGVLSRLLVNLGSEVGESMKVAELATDEIRRRLTVAETAFMGAERAYREATGELSALGEAPGNEERRTAAAQTVQARKRLYDDAYAKREEIRKELNESILRSTGDGTVSEIRAKENNPVKAGETIMVLDPKDSFYLFNRSLAIICLVISTGCFIRFFGYRRASAG